MSQLLKPKHRVVVCRGEYCNLGRRADSLLKTLRAAVDEINTTHAAAHPDEPPCVGVRTANCLSLCGKGPNLIIYPEDIVVGKLDDESLREVIDTYLRE